VFSFLSELPDLGHHAADCIVERGQHAGIGPAFAVGDVREPGLVRFGRFQRRMDGVEREVQEIRAIVAADDEIDGLAGKSVGQVLRFVSNHLAIVKDRIAFSRTVRIEAARPAEEPVEEVEPALVRA
jgi:hypothetical protein